MVRVHDSSFVWWGSVIFVLLPLPHSPISTDLFAFLGRRTYTITTENKYRSSSTYSPTLIHRISNNAIVKAIFTSSGADWVMILQSSDIYLDPTSLAIS